VQGASILTDVALLAEIGLRAVVNDRRAGQGELTQRRQVQFALIITLRKIPLYPVKYP